MLRNLLAAALVLAGLASGAAIKRSRSGGSSADAGGLADRVPALEAELARLRLRRVELIWEQAFQSLARSENLTGPSELAAPVVALASAEGGVIEPLESGPEAEEEALLRARIAELEAELAEADPEAKARLSDSAMAAKVSSIRARFAEALKDGDGPAAMALMAELAALDERAFPALVELWGQMREAGWPGVDKRERLAWANPEVLRWALLGEGLGDDAVARRFLREAIGALRHIEPDFARQAATLLAYLEKNSPQQFNARQLRKLGNRVSKIDPYRNALRQLGRIDDPASAARLGAVANQADLPRDMRLQAIDGLRRQRSDAAENALRVAMNDADPRVRQAAELALGRRNPAATGYFITEHDRKSQARELGIAPGAIILSFEGKPVRRERDIERLRRRVKGPTASIQVYQDGQVRTVQLDPKRRLGIDGDSVQKRGS